VCRPDPDGLVSYSRITPRKNCVVPDWESQRSDRVLFVLAQTAEGADAERQQHQRPGNEGRGFGNSRDGGGRNAAGVGSGRGTGASGVDVGQVRARAGKLERQINISIFTGQQGEQIRVDTGISQAGQINGQGIGDAALTIGGRVNLEQRHIAGECLRTVEDVQLPAARDGSLLIGEAADGGGRQAGHVDHPGCARDPTGQAGVRPGKFELRGGTGGGDGVQLERGASGVELDIINASEVQGGLAGDGREGQSGGGGRG